MADEEAERAEQTEQTDALTGLEPGQPIIYGGNRVARVSPELARSFASGDRLLVVDSTGDLLHIPRQEWEIATETVGRAHRAFLALGSVSDDRISDFFDRFADALADDGTFSAIVAANAEDVVRAKERGRSTTRLELSDRMRADMIDGLRMWRDTKTTRDAVTDVIDHDGWRIEQRTAGLGVVGFVFEGRPNV
ncbi:MAG: glutamate-5-semialdehyde dehydrogenase, partial [Actinomycetota bacterium]